jgi:SAM-dependent methyltransferase
MNKPDLLTPRGAPIELSDEGRVPLGTRPPAKSIQCLLPVWGHKFVRQFLDVSLPTWLAPGNLPALAAALPTKFLLLTSREDEPYLRLHPAIKRFGKICPIEIRLIDHLITGNNYSTTITLAYTEAIRSTGAALVDTYFFFLVSDYIIADGSFASVLKRMQAGRSGVLVGNFQVVDDDALPWLSEQLNRHPEMLSLKPREAMRWALSHLHPTTVANTVNYPLAHNDHTNRLFWRVDGQTLIGRFYLMHMICIRPETVEFVIGSSCDYSFIPELCPSDDVEIIADSDEYFVTEMQPRWHESKFLRPGPLKPAKLAKTLSTWTTARHRENAATTVIFHAAEIPAESERLIAAADSFLARVGQGLSKTPKSHREHPYWQGAIAAFYEATGTKLSADEWRLALGLTDPASDRRWLSDWMFEKARFVLFGKPPGMRVVHPRWPDHMAVLEELRTFFESPSQRLLLISDSPTVFTASLADSGERVVRQRTHHFLERSPKIYDPLLNTFDICLVEMREDEMSRSDEIVDRIAPLMKSQGKILISIYNQRNRGEAGRFLGSIGIQAARLQRPAAGNTEFQFVAASRFRWWIFRSIVRLAQLLRRSPVVGAPYLLLGGLPLALASCAANMSAKKVRELPPQGLISSALFAMTVDPVGASDAHKYSASRLVRRRERARLGLPHDQPIIPFARVGEAPDVSGLVGQQATKAMPVRYLPGGEATPPVTGPNPTPADAASGDSTREPQYDRCVELRDQFGLTPLGLMTNQVWHDDPRRLTFLLARYKFVAKMLSGKKFVGELGCGDAFGTRIVLQEVGAVIAYDFDPVFIEDLRHRRSEAWPVDGYTHDIVSGILPNRHDGIYSLDVIEHIAVSDEQAYVANLRGSLTQDGVLIIGTPSLESQTYASPPSKAGHVNCKSGPQLKSLLQNYFEHVFLFSMNDEVVHTGYYPMAHYLFAICCGKK